eukprot:7380441-Prymnesium_polylepis.1
MFDDGGTHTWWNPHCSSPTISRPAADAAAAVVRRPRPVRAVHRADVVARWARGRRDAGGGPAAQP